MKILNKAYLYLVGLFYNIFYRINPEQEVFVGYLTHYLSRLGFDNVHLFLNNERVQRQTEFLNYHNYKQNYQGAVFIAGCCYAEFSLGFKHHHQCLAFGQTLSDVFNHRHQFEEKPRSVVIAESLERMGVTETVKLSRELNKAIDKILTY